MEALRAEIDRHEVVSFDVFDTLLARNVATVVDVFTIAHELFNQDSGYTLQDEFRPLRIRAEREARLSRVNADITLDDVYTSLKKIRPDYPDEIIDALKEFELKAESAVLVRGGAANLYDYAVSQGKKVAIVSDMYLPKKSIEAFLLQNGIDKWDTFILSCEDHVSKMSGTSFVALQESFPGASILHIGDNYHDDIEMARRHGVDASHIQSNVELLKNRDIVERYNFVWERRLSVPETAYLGQVGQSVIDGIVANYLSGRNDDIAKLVGFSVLGPLLLGFSQWLHESLSEDGCHKVLFLARDGNIMHRAYNLIYQDEAINNEYIFGSRRALVFPSLQSLSGEDIKVFAQLDRGASLKATLEVFNLHESDKEVRGAAKKAGVNLNVDTIDASTAPKVEAMLLSLKDMITKSIIEEKNVVLSYLDSVGFDGDKRVAVCDIGWNGSVRTVIEGYVGREVPGYYLGLRNVDKTQSAGDKIKGYFDARKEFDWREFAPVVAGGVEVIEFLFSNPDQGPIKRIERSEKGDFYAPENPHDFPDDRRQMIRNIQGAALDFIEEYKKATKMLPRSLWHLDRHSGLSNVVNLIDRPTSRTAHAIGTSPYSTSVGSRPELIGAPVRSNLYYRTHFRSLKREWAKSFWAQGFKKNAEIRGLKRHGL